MLSDKSVMLTAPAVSSIAWTIVNKVSKRPGIGKAAEQEGRGHQHQQPVGGNDAHALLLARDDRAFPPLPSEKPDAPATIIAGMSTAMPASTQFLTVVIAACVAEQFNCGRRQPEGRNREERDGARRCIESGFHLHLHSKLYIIA